LELHELFLGKIIISKDILNYREHFKLSIYFFITILFVPKSIIDIHISINNFGNLYNI